MSFQGLGLPPQSHAVFTNLLNIATNGEAHCPQTPDSVCILPRPCASYYPDLWNYSFRIEFSHINENFLIVPLATFATDATENGNQVCKIYVQYIDNNGSQPFDSSIILGTMFYQAIKLGVYSQFSLTVPYYTTLSINENALNNTYVGNKQTYPGVEAFTVRTEYL